MLNDVNPAALAIRLPPHELLTSWMYRMYLSPPNQ